MATSLLVLSVLAIGLAVAGVSYPIVRRLFRKPLADELTAEWLESFSLDRYQVMSNVLSKDDFTFLSRQPGFDLSLYKKLRRERLAIFRQYLNRLIVDFNRLHLTARLLVAQNSVDCSELASRLISLKFQFVRAVMLTEVAFFLTRFGLATVDVKRLLEPLAAMSEQLSAVAVGQAA